VSFEEVLDQASAMLQRRGRLTCRMLKRQVHLDAEALEDLTFELIQGQRLAIEEEGEVLVWTGEPLAATPDAQRVAEAERRFHTLLPAVIGLLQSQRRVTYRTLTYIFSIDETLREEIREELTFRRLAIDEGGKGLVWTGEVQSIPPPVSAVPSPQVPADTPSVPSPAVPTLPPRITETRTPSYEPTISADAIATDVPQATSTPVSEPTRPGPEAERRQLTVMFCDLADSTKLSQQLDPEDLREVVRAYQETAAAVIHQYEGHIAQYLGDGLLSYFGWPKAHEDDAQRALHSGLGIVDAITSRLNPHLHHEKGVQLAVRVGLHTGPVVVGEMGGGGRHEHLATGDTVNIATRLEGLAAPNTVVISRVTARLVRQAFALADLGPHALKGVAEPMPVFRVLRPLEEHADEPVAAGVPFLVGRDEELGLLRRRWEQAKERLGQVVLLSGTAGIGKSSLVEVLRAQVRDEGLPRLALRCSAYHQHSALYPVIAHVERLLDFQREDAPTTRLAKLEQGLRPSRLPLDEVVPLFAALLSVPLEGRYAAPTLPPQQQKQQTLDALVVWMLAEAERQPVLVAWEDLHWADPSTLEMLGLVLEQTPTVPMLHVLTARPEFTPPWPTRSHMTPITLTRLERP
jgi:class 3 adenylate cyclase